MDGYAVAKYLERFTFPRDQHSVPNGRVYKVDERKCIVSDMMTWSADMSDCVQGRFPGCIINVQHSTSSITGFLVIIAVDHCSKPMMRTVILLTISLILLSTTVFLLSKQVQDV
jgi:hypothetical protein